MSIVFEITTDSPDFNQLTRRRTKNNYFKFMILKSDQSFARIEWNEKKCHIVAIDGQHRLSGLNGLLPKVIFQS